MLLEPLATRMPPHRKAATIALFWLPMACASHPGPSARDVADANDLGATLRPNDEIERLVLARASTLPSNQVQRLRGDIQVAAEPAYTAASGRTCRSLQLTETAKNSASTRLACSDGKTWFFVPDVFAPSPIAEPE